jgi:hypothetical protein
VNFGRRSNGQAIWEGRVVLAGEFTEMKKLISSAFENGVGSGVEIGGVADIESAGPRAEHGYSWLSIRGDINPYIDGDA